LLIGINGGNFEVNTYLSITWRGTVGDGVNVEEKEKRRKGESKMKSLMGNV
jgi:hypothetical protein